MRKIKNFCSVHSIISPVLGFVFAVSGSLQADPNLIVDIQQARTPPVIDADLGDWGSSQWIRFAPGAPHMSSFVPLRDDGSTEPAGTAGTAADLSGSFALQWDDDWLYLAVRVTDNVHDVSGVGRGLWWTNDAVSLFLDVPLDGDGPDWIPGDHAFSFVADPTEPEHGKWWRNGDLAGQLAPTETRMEVWLTEKGYRLEAAIPMVALTQTTPDWTPPFGGRMIGFVLLLTDPDGGSDTYGGQLGYGGSDDDDADWARLRFCTTRTAPVDRSGEVGSSVLPTLARLCFEVPPERRRAFEAVYEERMAPLLQRHGLVASTAAARPAADSAFTRLFALPTPAEVIWKRVALETDPAWWIALRALGTAAGITDPDSLAHGDFHLYAAPVGPGKIVQSGPGVVQESRERSLRAGAAFRQGAWLNLGISEGIGFFEILDLEQDDRGHLWLGTNGSGVICYDGERWTVVTTAEEGLLNKIARIILKDRKGDLWFGVGGNSGEDGGVIRYDGERWTTYRTTDGLGINLVTSLLEDRQGNLWLGTEGSGVVRYDGRGWTTYTTADGLPNNAVGSLLEDREGNLWLGTPEGVSQYHGLVLETFPALDYPMPDRVRSMVEDRQGNLWFGTDKGGVYRYDGRDWTTYTTEDGLPSNAVESLLEDREGHMWFGTGIRVRGASMNWTFADAGGACRYDGEGFTTVAVADGLAHAWVTSILEDRKGVLWFGTWGGGVSRYDGRQDVGERFATFSVDDGLAHDNVWTLFEDREGSLWIGTEGGMSWFDGRRDIGEQFVTFNTKNGLVHNTVASILQDREGHMWFGTLGGVSRYDGQVFQTLLQQDGLASNTVWDLHQDRNGDVWIATEGGLTRYSPRYTPPLVQLTSAMADRRYDPAEEISVPSSQEVVVFEFRGISLKTHPDQMVYQYRLEGYDDGWRSTRETRVEYTDLPRGEYLFQVKAVDRDLGYSEEPVEMRAVVHWPYELALWGGLGIALMGLVVVSGYALRQRHALFVEMEEELQTAHEMQMKLMPAEAPRIPGIDVAGRCLPANHVGGDFFQYFQGDNRLSLCLVDVTGHAMEAAIPVVMFDGILESQMEQEGSLEDLFSRLNRSLHRTHVDSRTYVCFAMGEIDLNRRNLRLANSGCPYPYHYSAIVGEVVELSVDAYPLGVRPDTIYSTIELSLSPGDRVVFCSDGIAETTNVEEEMFGFERTAETIRQACSENLSAEALIDRLIDTVKEFAGDVPQGDDMTCVVLEVGSRQALVSSDFPQQHLSRSELDTRSR